MKNRTYLIGATLVAVAALSLALTQNAGSQVAQQANKLEGSWIAKVPGTAIQWNYTMAPLDPSGHRAALTSTLHVRIPGEVFYPGVIPPVDYFTPFVGEVVMTGPNTAKYKAVGYGMKKVVPSESYPFFEQVAYICAATGDVKFTGPGKIEIIHQITNYLPSADLDGDGLPDPGQAPLIALPPTPTIDTRVGLLPPYTP
jgi:hypothetical protein